MRPPFCILALTLTIAGCVHEQPTPLTAAGGITGIQPTAANLNSSEEEEIIGSGVYGASSTTQYVVSGPGGTAAFYQSWAKHKWGVFSNQAHCPTDGEYHDTNLDGVVDSSDGSSEAHCANNGPFEGEGGFSVSGGGRTWTRDVALLDSLGYLGFKSGSSAYHDVSVQLDVGSPTTTLSGSMRASTTYQGLPDAIDTTAYSTADLMGIADSAVVYFISTVTAQSGGQTLYGMNDILNSYNFDAARSGAFRGGVNSVGASAEADRRLPFRHVFRSPGRTATYQVVHRVVEPYHASMSAGRPLDTIQVQVVADSNCLTASTVTEGSPTTLTVSCRDPATVGYVHYLYQYGDGASSSSTTDTSATHTYSSWGSYTARLLTSLSSGEGPVDTTTRAVTVSNPGTCSFSPSGTVRIEVASQQLFTEDDDGACVGKDVYLSPANGDAGFNFACSTTHVTIVTGAFRVYGCQTGTVYVNVYDGATLLQTITIIVADESRQSS